MDLSPSYRDRGRREWEEPPPHEGKEPGSLNKESRGTITSMSFHPAVTKGTPNASQGSCPRGGRGFLGRLGELTLATARRARRRLRRQGSGRGGEPLAGDTTVPDQIGGLGSIHPPGCQLGAGAEQRQLWSGTAAQSSATRTPGAATWSRPQGESHR